MCVTSSQTKVTLVVAVARLRAILEPLPHASAVVDLPRVVADDHLVLIFARRNLEGAFPPSKTCLPRAESPLLSGFRTQPGAAQAERSLPALPPEC